MNHNTSVTVRRADGSDAAMILEITREAFTIYAQELGQPEKVYALQETIETIKRDIAEKAVYIGFVDGSPMGSIRYERIEGNLAYISRFGVKPEAQKCGMGRELVAAVEQDCRKEGISAIALHTCTKMLELVRFYYGRGFYIHSTTHDRGYVRGLFLKELTDQTHETLELDFVKNM